MGKALPGKEDDFKKSGDCSTGVLNAFTRIETPAVASMDFRIKLLLDVFIACGISMLRKYKVTNTT
jgi:hypothetical protein